MFGASHVDNEGKTIAKSAPAFSSEETSEEALRATILQDMRFHRQIVVSSGIEPARNIIQREHSPSEEVFEVLADLSPFVPAYHQTLFSLGFIRFFQGDMISAGTILIPQLENSLRHLLKTSGADPLNDRK